MMSNEDYRDRILSCRECGQDFTFSAGEQAFFATKGLTHTPSRCPSCRSARRSGVSGPATSAPRQQYETTCATCGRPTSVPFVPTEGRAVYCNDCFQTQRATRPPRRDDAPPRSYNSGGGGGYSNSSYGNDSSYGGSSGGRGGRERGDRRGGRDSGGRDGGGRNNRRDDRW